MELSDHQSKVFQQYLNGEIPISEYYKALRLPLSGDNHYYTGRGRSPYKPSMVVDQEDHLLALTIRGEVTMLWNTDRYNSCSITRKGIVFLNTQSVKILYDKEIGITYYYVKPLEKEESS